MVLLQKTVLGSMRNGHLDENRKDVETIDAHCEGARLF
jgi:hypothetical protein